MFIAELLDAQTIGLIVGIAGCAVVLHITKERGGVKKLAFYCFTVVSLLVSYSWGYELMLQTYAAGLKRAVFTIASEAQWNSTLLVAENYRMNPKQNQSLDWSLFPHFVGKLCPGRFLFCGIFEPPPATNNLHIMFSWDGGNFDTGIEIGDVTPKSLELRHHSENVIFREQYSTNMAVILVQ